MNTHTPSTHTPSDWYLSLDEFCIVETKNDNGEPFKIADCGVSRRLSNLEMKSNARLIAAAPDLLAALELIVLNYFCDMEWGCEHPEITQATQAIAKAKGSL